MKISLFLLILFVGITSFISGILLIIYPDGAIFQLPLSLLSYTPFKNFFLPGILLSLLVGGTNLVAAFKLIRKSPARFTWCMAGGMAITGWIVTEIILIQSFHWLHVVYLVAGVFILLISFHIKGKELI